MKYGTCQAAIYLRLPLLISGVLHRDSRWKSLFKETYFHNALLHMLSSHRDLLLGRLPFAGIRTLRSFGTEEIRNPLQLAPSEGIRACRISLAGLTTCTIIMYREIYVPAVEYR